MRASQSVGYVSRQLRSGPIARRCVRYVGHSTVRREEAERLGPAGPSAEQIAHYKNDTQSLARWLDMSVIKRKGRVFDADAQVIPAAQAMVFPPIVVAGLNGDNAKLPLAVTADAKLIAFSFKHYGFALVRSWMDPFLEQFHPASASTTLAAQNRDPKSIVALEICFVEFGFLSIAKSLFASSIKSAISPSQVDRTYLCFGGIVDFASKMLLPNSYTGYVCLLDRQNRIRWRACGEATEKEIAVMLEAAEAIANEKV